MEKCHAQNVSEMFSMHLSLSWGKSLDVLWQDVVGKSLTARRIFWTPWRFSTPHTWRWVRGLYRIDSSSPNGWNAAVSGSPSRLKRFEMKLSTSPGRVVLDSPDRVLPF